MPPLFVAQVFTRTPCHCRASGLLSCPVPSCPPCLMQITLAPGSLSTVFTVTNTDSKPFDFTTALHSYFRVSACQGWGE